MNIALLTDGIYPVVTGGMQKHSYYMAKFLARKGVHVDLYLLMPKNEKIDLLHKYFSDDELKNITFLEIKFPKLVPFPGHYLLESYIYSKRIFSVIENRKRVDLIYAQGFTGWKLISEKKRGAKLPVIWLNFHGLEMFQKAKSLSAKLKQMLFISTVQSLIKNADYTISLGGKITAILEKFIPPKKIITLPIGIDKNWLADSTQNGNSIRTLCFIGRFEERKGIRELNSVLKSLLPKYDFHFEFVGFVPEEIQIKNNKIKYYGTVQDEQKIKEILLNSDALILPSHAEGMPTVILEAMSSGCAIIATDVGAVNTMVSNENGWLIDIMNEAQLSDAIKELLTLSEDDLRTKKNKSRELTKEHFIWDSVIEKTILEIERVI
ncbi:MAG: glycosyltransferase family 4 protein [Melioribacteraceae bacterium]|nr:glycosyltransferase family 4 protein [Melioribacteraceae bacterium]MCF8262868.1 glycosyltransferase family 4 protein [Melioribacteraceae bacterium]MCF8430904.1 glycosyltransferase family 4 protein [Melioribacteraceae bacterium]